MAASVESREIYRRPLYLAVAACDRNSIKYSCNKQGKRKFIWNGLAGSARCINLCPLDHLSLAKPDFHRIAHSIGLDLPLYIYVSYRFDFYKSKHINQLFFSHSHCRMLNLKIFFEI